MASPRQKAAAPAVAAPEPETRAIAREEARPAVIRGPDGRLQALNRQGQYVSRASAGAGIDQFHVPPDAIPPGWSWEWKNESVLGKTDPQYESMLAQVGWEPVMYESHPGIFGPPDAKGAVRRHGMQLMERRIELTLEAQRDEKRRADEKLIGARRKHGKLDTQGAHGVDVNHVDLNRRAVGGVNSAIGIRQGREQIAPTPGQYDRQQIE